MPQFDTTTFSSQIFWLLICFLILLVFFSFVYLPKMRLIFQKREHHIHDVKLEVARLMDEAKSLNEKFDSKVDAFIHEQKHDLDTFRKKLSSELFQFESDVQTNLATKIEQLKEDLEKENAAALSILPATLAPLISDFCTKNLNAKDLHSTEVLQRLNEEMKNESHFNS